MKELKEKSKIQKEALESLLKNNITSTCKGGIASMCTGSGKSKVALDYIKHLMKTDKSINIALIVPTIKLRDNNWKDEFEKWDMKSVYRSKVERYCYASIANVKDKYYDLVILDEVHHLTEANSVFLRNNEIKNLIGLTATIPENKEELLNSFNLKPIYTLTLEEGVEKGVVAPYDIYIIHTELDDKEKYIKAGNAKKTFYITEKAQYSYFNKLMRNIMFVSKEYPMWLVLKRMRFLFNLKSKTEGAIKILSLIPEDVRLLIFCGSIEQSETVCKHTYHSKTDDLDLNAFLKGDINRLSCVDALNEGINVPEIDAILIVQSNSKDTSLIQRIGRAVRYREGHRAKVFIMSVRGTQDEVWVSKALSKFDPLSIKEISIKRITQKIINEKLN